MKLIIRGDADHSIYSIPSDEFCRRQSQLLSKVCGQEALLVLRSDIVATDTLLTWLSQSGPAVISSAAGEPLLAFGSEVDKNDLIGVFEEFPKNNFKTYIAGQSSFFARKLRRREPIDVYDLKHVAPKTVEKALFDLSYKGITDCVTKYVFPIPTLLVVRVLSRFKITPNAVTIIGILLCILATVLFYQGPIAWALVCAWVMTFLDTVDGKLARVTATSSEIGNILDHGTDLIHPPFWWAFIGLGILKLDTGVSSFPIYGSIAALLMTYFIGRFAEEYFKRRFGFNAYMWRPFDKVLRLFIARRNTVLVILTLGFFSGFYAQSFCVAAVWAVLTVGVQLCRLALAIFREGKGEKIAIFLREPDEDVSLV